MDFVFFRGANETIGFMQRKEVERKTHTDIYTHRYIYLFYWIIGSKKTPSIANIRDTAKGNEKASWK